MARYSPDMWVIAHTTNRLYWSETRSMWVADLKSATVGSQDYITIVANTSLTDRTRVLVTRLSNIDHSYGTQHEN